MKPTDTYVPFSNGHEHRVWLDINCHRGEKGCRRYRPLASSSKNGCPIEVAIAFGAANDGTIPMRIALRGGFVEPGPNGRLVEVERCRRARREGDPARPPEGQIDLLDPRSQPERIREFPAVAR